MGSVEAELFDEGSRTVREGRQGYRSVLNRNGVAASPDTSIIRGGRIKPLSSTRRVRDDGIV